MSNEPVIDYTYTEFWDDWGAVHAFPLNASPERLDQLLTECFSSQYKTQEEAQYRYERLMTAEFYFRANEDSFSDYVDRNPNGLISVREPLIIAFWQYFSGRPQERLKDIPNPKSIVELAHNEEKSRE